MTAKTTTTKPRALPWAKWNAEIERQIAAHTTPESIEATIQAHLAGQTKAGVVRIYSNSGTSEEYTVGYGGERTYATRPAAPARIVNGASDKQKDLIDRLLTERVHSYTEADVEAAKADWRLTRKMIDFLLDPSTPRRSYQAPAPVEAPIETVAPARTRLDFSAIPDGNYAVREDSVVKFYRVSTSKRGFKNVQVRASDDLHMLFGKASIAVLHRIVEAGLEASQMLFAIELGRCWRCGKSLTDEESRARGMGPDCASK